MNTFIIVPIVMHVDDSVSFCVYRYYSYICMHASIIILRYRIAGGWFK